MSRNPNPDPPVQMAASLEQSLRWIAYQRPPRKAGFERLLEYEPVLERVSWDEGMPGFLPAGAPRVQDAYRRLMLALATGELTAKGIPYERQKPDVDASGEVHGDYVCPLPRSVKVLIDMHTVSQGRVEDIPAELWLEWQLVWGDPGAFDEKIMCGDNYYQDIHIPLEEVKRVFPATTEPDVVTEGEQCGRWVPAVSGVLYTTNALAVLDILRAEIEATGDWNERPVKREWVVSRGMEMGLSETKALAVPRVLSPRA